MSALGWALVTATAVGAAACSPPRQAFLLPQPISANPVPRVGGLKAGFGRADITPPPGVGLNGNGFEGQQARGYRHRLYARALVLESAAGERVALVVADLGQVSATLHRLTAARISQLGSGIGADRLIVSATHTHAGPGNFSEVEQYNAQAGVFSGYDPYMVEFLVTGLASAVVAAVMDLGPAKAAWGALPVPGVTRNRSLDAFLLDPEATAILGPVVSSPAARHDSTLMRRAVNDTLLMLRVDRCTARWDSCRPHGAFSVFAIHGTVYPPANDLLDGDIHALVERGLERYIDSTPPPGEPPRAVHVLANGTEGDVSPDWPAGSRCGQYLKFRAGRRPAGPRTPAPPEEWRLPVGSLNRCLAQAERSASVLGARLSAAAIMLYESIESRLTSEFPLARAFETVDLHRLATSHPLCPQPLTGTANYAGAADGETRLNGWKFAWLIPSGIEQGGSAVDADHTTCHGAKRIGLGGLQRLLVGRRGLPQYAQLAVLQLGNTVLATVPGEATTVAGMRMKQALRENGPRGAAYVAVIGLANGYLQYVPTAEEYEAQDYEGGSAIYGPQTAAALTEELATLAGSLARGAPKVRVDSLVAVPGPSHSYFPQPTAGPAASGIKRRFLRLSCSSGTLSATWVDLYPGPVLPARGAFLEIEREDAPASATWRALVWDDGIEVRALGPLGSQGYRWAASAAIRDSARYRVVVRGRRDGAPLAPLSSSPIVCPARDSLR